MTKLALLLVLSCLGQFDLQTEVNNAVVQSLGDNKGKVVTLAPGVYQLSQTLQVPSNIGLAIDGGSMGAVTLVWTGPATDNMIEFSGCHHVELRNMTLLCSNPCKNMLYISRKATDRYISTTCTVDNVAFGNNQPKCETCVSIVNTGGDSNNELHRFRRCEFSGYTKYGWYVNGSQIHALVFDDCTMLGNLNADYGGYTEYGTFFHWNRGSGGYHRVADFRLGRFYHVVTVNGWNSEGSGALLHSEKADYNPAPITIRDVRWIGAAANPTINMLHPGPLTVTGCLLISDTGNPTIRVSGLSGHASGQVVVVGNSVTAKDNYSATKPFILKNSDFAVIYEGNNFFNSTTGTPSIGDQAVLSNGLPVLTKSQDGILTRSFQEISANKLFANTLDGGNTGISIQSISSDGRVSIGPKVGKGAITFWNRWDQVSCDGVWSFPNMTSGNGRTTFHATGAAPYSSNTNGLHWVVPSVSNENETITAVAMRYAAAKQPALQMFAREVAFGTVPDPAPAATFGTVKMRVTNEGIYLGTVRFTPTDDGDILLNSAKFNNTKLSSLIPVQVTPIEIGSRSVPK